MNSVSLIETGTANLASVSAAFERLGLKSRVVQSPEQLDENEIVVLPGVGSFGPAIDSLRQRGWDQLLQQRFANDQPTLAICLGLQLLCECSAESDGIPGLGIIPAAVRRLPAEVMIPQLGWNQVVCEQPEDVGYAYFANSYCAVEIQRPQENGWNVWKVYHGIEFLAATSRGNWLACQFHPELSGEFGRRLLQRWLNHCLQNDTRSTTVEESAC